MAFIANSFSNNGIGNIVYSNGAAEAEKISLILFDSLPEETVSKSINDLIKLIKRRFIKNIVWLKSCGNELPFIMVICLYLSGKKLRTF